MSIVYTEPTGLVSGARPARTYINTALASSLAYGYGGQAALMY